MQSKLYNKLVKMFYLFIFVSCLCSIMYLTFLLKWIRHLIIAHLYNEKSLR